MKSKQEVNKALVTEAFNTLFNKRDYATAEKFWSPKYIQHSAHIEPGREGLFNLIKKLPATLKWTHGVILAEDNFVIIHGCYSGHGLPAPWIVADIVRIENGVLAEHWDVIQDEATREQSKSGLPMFGNSFPEPDHQPAATPLTITEARTIVAPLYDALNQPSNKDVAALLAKAAHSNYRSYHTNEDFLTRDQLAGVFKNLGLTVPDLRWEIKDIKTIGDQVVVRGEATGTPTGEFWGAKPTGKGFKTMALDIFTVKNGKLASAYHVENWMTALQQVSSSHAMITTTTAADANKALVLAGIKGVFIDRDPSVLDRLFSNDYQQHNPQIPNGTAAIKALLRSLPADFRYEPGLVVADGNYVTIHGRYIGWGPKSMVAVDIFRVANGKIAEHWDILQEEVPAGQSANGNSMLTTSQI